MPGFLWNEFPCGRSKHRGTTNKDLLFNYSSHYSVWIASGSVSSFDFTERPLAKTLGLQPAGMVKLRFANTANAALCEHRKRSEVQHCRKKTLGHQWSPKSTWGINCKQNSALRCLEKCLRFERTPHDLSHTQTLRALALLFPGRWRKPNVQVLLKSRIFWRHCIAFWHRFIALHAFLGWHLGNMLLRLLSLHSLHTTLAKTSAGGRC